jgi:hypothetical protein
VLLAREKATFSRFSPPLWLMGPKCHQHPAVRTVSVAHAQEDDVALVALDVLQVLDQQSGELAVLFALVLSSRRPRNSASAAASASSAGLDRPLLRLREGRTMPMEGPRLAGQKTAHEMRDVARFGTVAPVLVRPCSTAGGS